MTGRQGARRTSGRTAAGRESGPTPGEGNEADPPGKPAPGLHVVATPIGNLGDLTPRALATLARADAVACEDTRVTARLLSLHGVRRDLRPYHEHNAERERPKLLALLASGASLALASDAGTPLVSDPGYKLVRAALDAGHAVRAVPGPSALLAALAVAGLPTDRFLFAGFLASRDGRRRTELRGLAGIDATLVLFESAERLATSLAAMAEVLGPRQAAVTRELTKRFEETRRGRLDALAAHYAEAGAPKGEVVVVVGPPEAEAAPAPDAAGVDALLADALAGLPPPAAAARVAAATGLPRRDLYRRALALKRPGP